MKTFSATVLALLAASTVGAQSLAPSPTQSVGCEPHGDHWHCEGPAVTPTGAAPATTTTHNHDDHDETGTGSLAPSPTESVGCEPHGNHWHCDGPASGSVAAATTSSDHASGTGSLAPSPTNSVGCQPHGDHWHCSGPATGASTAASTPSSSTTPAPAAAAGVVEVNKAVIIGGLLAAIAL